jgi:hypothetical protein
MGRMMGVRLHGVPGRGCAGLVLWLTFLRGSLAAPRMRFRSRVLARRMSLRLTVWRPVRPFYQKGPENLTRP